ncbi:MAG: hypothetical protein ACXW4U_17865 [Anaerolineales bacterium]
MVQQQAEPQVKNEPMESEKNGPPADLLKQLSSLWHGIVDQRPWVSFLGLSELCVRDKIITTYIIER